MNDIKSIQYIYIVSSHTIPRIVRFTNEDRKKILIVIFYWYRSFRGATLNFSSFKNIPKISLIQIRKIYDTWKKIFWQVKCTWVSRVINERISGSESGLRVDEKVVHPVLRFEFMITS